jgi:hypothetical protein
MQDLTPDGRRAAAVRAASFARRLGTAAVVCAVAAIVAALFVGGLTFVLLAALASLLGLGGLVASILELSGFRDAKRDAAAGLTTSLVAVLGLLVFVLFLVWLVRNADWGW